MISINHTCDSCESKFTIRYDEHQCEDDPHFCSFCGEMLVDIGDVSEDDD